MIVDVTNAVASRPLVPSGPLEKAEPVERRPVEGTAENPAPRLDVQREKNRRDGGMEGHDGEPESRPQTYDAKGSARESQLDLSRKRAGSETVDLFV